MKWVGQHLENLLNKDIDELTALYPEQTRKNLIRRKQEKRMERPKESSGERTENGRLVSTWEMMSKNQDGEPEVTTLHKYEYKAVKELILQPVEAAIITPDRRKPPVRDHKVIFVWSDAQLGYRRIDGELVPIHDETAIKAALLLAGDLRPDTVVDCGDTTDFAELSRFSPDSDHFSQTLQPSLQRTHDLFAEFTAATPGAERITVWSNHVKRLTDYILKNAPALYNVKGIGDTYPAMSYPGLLKLDKIGWNYADGYPGEYQCPVRRRKVLVRRVVA